MPERLARRAIALIVAPMTNKLATALATVIAEQQLTGNYGKVAERIGVSYPSLRAVLAGKGKPNKATAAKYQKFLGIGAEDFAHLLADAPRGGRPTKAARAAKDVRATEPVTQSAPDSAAKAPRSIPPAVATAGGKDLDRALAALNDVLADDLALRVHAASPGLRALIARIVR